MNIVQMLLTIGSWHPMTIWISSIGFGFTAVVFIGIPLIRRTRSKRRLKKILKAYDGVAAVVCNEYSSFSKLPAETLMYLIASNDILLLTTAMDTSVKIEIPFAKMKEYVFNGTKLIIMIDSDNGLNSLRVDLCDYHDADGAFNRYALKHANIIDYIAARVPKKQVHIQV